MLRHSLLIMMILGTAGSARASTWAEGMFEELTFNFGSVPKGQVVMHPFRIVNNTKNTVRIARVRATCYCTKAEALQYTLAPGQETAVIASMDTRLFDGVRAITIYVEFSSPQYEEVRLGVQSNSRSELEYAPESLEFRKIKQGATPTAQMTVKFYGQPQVQVKELRCESSFIQPKIQELRRDGAEVIYQVSATIRNDIPIGKWYTDVWLTTNNPATPQLRIPVNVEVEPIAAPTPQKSVISSIVLEPVKKGIETDRKVILRGTQPFRITGIQGKDQDQELIVRPASSDSKAIHEITLTFRPSQVGAIHRTIRVHTDMNSSRDIEFNVQTKSIP